uniref:Pus10 N-terminal eukaryotes domain-containing protein n=1 Tax=Nothoprocta perdicaria TaxID=30464 RepID=A0A8C6YX78_NOTPE
MSSLTEKDRPIVQLLLSTGTCPRCIFRFCCMGSQAPYKRPYKDTVCIEVADPPCKRIRLENTEEQPDDLNENGVLKEIPLVNEDNTALESSAVKVCNVCLGILQEFCEVDFVKKVNIQFFICMSGDYIPIKLNHQDMGKQAETFTQDDIVQLKEAYKWIIHPQLSEELGVPADGKSLFEVSVVFAHPETDEECHFLARACPDCFKPAKNKQSVFTRMAVIKALEKIKEEDFFLTV